MIAMTRLTRGRYAGPLLLMLLLAWAGGCRRPADAPPADDVRVEPVAWGPIRMEFRFSPPHIRLDEDLLLEIRITAPDGMAVDVPDLADRLSGLHLGGVFARDPSRRDGASMRSLHYRLTPIVADEYRLAPMAIRYRDQRQDPPTTGWFPTPPFVLDAQPLVADDPGTRLDADLKPAWIPPPPQTILLYIGLAIAVLALLWGLWRLLSRVREEVALRRMSPHERALRELDQLLRQDLINRGLIKDFYVALTMVVRRYIERQHRVRAPEQTTEEFLAAISRDHRFAGAIHELLQRFLESADRVKFAAYHPSAEAIETAIRTAREYLKRDAATVAPTAPAVEQER